MKIVIVDYGMGNIQSIVGALEFLGVSNIVVSAEYSALKSADKIILPGVGSFSKAMQIIRSGRLENDLREIIMHHKKPILGICLGMQLLALSSTEHGQHQGLGFIDAIVTQLDRRNVKVPHVGFDQVAVDPTTKLYKHLSGDVDFYFTHSFKMGSDHSLHACYCDYGEKFIASVEKNHIAGVQFHPELSQYHGLRVLKNFIELF